MGLKPQSDEKTFKPLARSRNFVRPRSRISSASTSIRPIRPWCWRSMKKSQIQALDRTQPGLPMKKGPAAGTMTHDYKRNGTTTLFSRLSTCSTAPSSANACPSHRHREFPPLPQDHRRTDTPQSRPASHRRPNYATHKTPAVKRWPSSGIRAFTCTSRPTSGSWLNMVERFLLPRSPESASAAAPSRASTN